MRKDSSQLTQSADSETQVESCSWTLRLPLLDRKHLFLRRCNMDERTYDRFNKPAARPYIERVAHTPEGLLIEFSHGPVVFYQTSYL